VGFETGEVKMARVREIRPVTLPSPATECGRKEQKIPFPERLGIRF
jgi:hypothetical protein